MDTFMEKLAEKFTAQEMIKANTVAEKQEMDRLKLQVQEYTQCLDRMKQICAEMEQTADTARNKMESVQVDTDGLKAELLKMWKDLQRANEEKDQAEQDTAGLDELRSVIQQQINVLQSSLEEKLDGLASAPQGIPEEELRAMQAQQLDDVVGSIRNLQLQQTEDVVGGVRNLQLQQTDEIVGNIRTMQAQQLEDIRGIQTEQVNQMRTMQQDQLDNLRSVLKAQISGLKEGQNQSDFILSEMESQRNALDAKIAEIKSGVEEQLGNSNEFVHRECVKVYRNVQAVIGDENKKQTENLDYTFNPMKDKLKKIFTISVVALIASIAGLLLQIMNLLHIF